MKKFELTENNDASDRWTRKKEKKLDSPYSRKGGMRQDLQKA